METIIVRGEARRIEDFKTRVKEIEANFLYYPSSEINLDEARYLIDLNLDDHPGRLADYASRPELTVVGCAVKRSLAEMAHSLDRPMRCTLLGINALPGFLSKERWELSSLDLADRSAFSALLQTWGMPHDFVADRVGMVTPRILCMIINEACYTVQEGTADVPDIDTAMRLGVNYPGGPFQWADSIGIRNVFELLTRLREDTGDARYKVAPYLKQAYLRTKIFYPTTSAHL